MQLKPRDDKPMMERLMNIRKNQHKTNSFFWNHIWIIAEASNRICMTLLRMILTLVKSVVCSVSVVLLPLSHFKWSLKSKYMLFTCENRSLINSNASRLFKSSNSSEIRISFLKRKTAKWAFSVTERWIVFLINFSSQNRLPFFQIQLKTFAGKWFPSVFVLFNWHENLTKARKLMIKCVSKHFSDRILRSMNGFFLVFYAKMIKSNANETQKSQKNFSFHQTCMCLFLDLVCFTARIVAALMAA